MGQQFAIGEVYSFKQLVLVASKNEASLRPIGLSDMKRDDQKQSRVVSQDAKAARLGIAKIVLEEGGSISEFARRVGINTSWATVWLRQNDEGLHRQFLDQRHPITLDPPRRVARLMAVKVGLEMDLSLGVIARRLGMKRNALVNWLETWAPDGIDDALELEAEDLAA